MDPVWKQLWVSVLSIGLLAGCGSDGEGSMSSSDEAAGPEFSTLFRERSAEPGAGEGSSSKPSSSDTEKALNKKGATVAQEERKVIYEGQLNIKVQDLKKAQQAMEEVARKEGGYLVESSQSRSEGEKKGNYVFRIPRESFHTYLDRLENLAQEVESRKITGKDVTEEYVDLESRLKTKKAVEKRLLEMMKGAKSTEDLLKVSEQLAGVQEEIEQLQGQLKYLENRTVYSTVSIQARQVISLKEPEGKPGLWHRISSSFIQSVGWLRDGFQGFLVVGAALLPPAALAAVIGLPVWGWYRRRKKKAPWESSG